MPFFSLRELKLRCHCTIFSLILRWSIVAKNALYVGFGEENTLVLLFLTVLVWWRRWAGKYDLILALIHDMQMSRL